MNDKYSKPAKIRKYYIIHLVIFVVFSSIVEINCEDDPQQYNATSSEQLHTESTPTESSDVKTSTVEMTLSTLTQESPTTTTTKASTLQSQSNEEQEDEFDSAEHDSNRITESQEIFLKEHGLPLDLSPEIIESFRVGNRRNLCITEVSILDENANVVKKETTVKKCEPEKPTGFKKGKSHDWKHKMKWKGTGTGTRSKSKWRSDRKNDDNPNPIRRRFQKHGLPKDGVKKGHGSHTKGGNNRSSERNDAGKSKENPSRTPDADANSFESNEDREGERRKRFFPSGQNSNEELRTVSKDMEVSA